jgi:excisionase family DNA binding protein
VRQIAAVPHTGPLNGTSVAPAKMRPWLTIAEAADYTGLPESFLLHMIEEGDLPALDVGVRPGGKWRVSRRALDGISAG